jgi:hypothetical protein
MAIIPITDRHRIVGEYLADPRWRITRYGVNDLSIDLGVADDDTASVRHAYEVAVVMGRHLDVVTLPVEDGHKQLVSVSWRRPDGLFVYVNSTHTDPLVVARLRALPDRIRDQRVIEALADPDGDGGG